MSVSVIQLDSHTRAQVSESKSEKWVTYGENNSYFDVLLDSKASTTNSRLINSITDLIYGRGLNAADANKKPEQYAEMIKLFKPDLLRCMCEDFYTQGQTAVQVVYNKEHTKIVKIESIPVKNLAPEKCNADGKILNYYYCDDWSKVKQSTELKKFPAFGTSKQGLEILYIKPYTTGFKYFAPVVWESGLDYAFVEIELGRFHLNNIQNRFSANTIINFNNGVPESEQQRVIESKIRDRFTGVDGDGLIVSFNNNETEAATIENPSLADAHNQYQFISEEATQKLLVSHGVTSPLLFGLPQNGGFGSNADEIKTASILFDNTVIKPLQGVLLDAINKVLSVNEIGLKTYFETTQPIEFTEVEQEEVEQEVLEEKTGVKMSSAICCSSDENDGLDELAEPLIDLGEDEDDEWELIEETEVDYTEDEELSLLRKVINLVSTGTARPNAKSEQDRVIDGVAYKTRYVYAPDAVQANSRPFCKKMVAANKIYRKEDIIAMGDKAVNAGWGLNGASTYSIWKWKGGGACHHRWLRRVYRKPVDEGKIDTKSPLAPTVSTNKSEKEGYRVRNPKEVAMRPIDRGDKGFVNK